MHPFSSLWSAAPPSSQPQPTAQRRIGGQRQSPPPWHLSAREARVWRLFLRLGEGEGGEGSEAGCYLSPQRGRILPYSSSSLPNYPFPPLSYIFPPLPKDIKSCLRQGDTQLFRRVKGEGLNNQIEPITTYRCTKILKEEGVIIYSRFHSPVPLRKRKRGQVSRQTPLLFGQKRKDAQKSNEGVDSAGGGGSLQRLPPLLLLIISRPLREKRETAKNWRRGGRSRNVPRKSGCSGFFKQYSRSRRRRKALLSLYPRLRN